MKACSDETVVLDKTRNKILMHSLKQIVFIIGLNLNAKKIKLINHNQEGIVTPGNAIPLKGVFDFIFEVRSFQQLRILISRIQYQLIVLNKIKQMQVRK